MLGVNLGIGDARCKEIATDVAFSLVCEAGPAADGAPAAHEPTMDATQFHQFRSLVTDPKGQQEFFHRTVHVTWSAKTCMKGEKD